MSNPFYEYLSEKIIKYFQANEPKRGDKFYIQFETEEQVNKLYEELQLNLLSSEFIYEDSERDQKYVSYKLKFGDTYLIIAASMAGGPHPDFLATLRNLVGVNTDYEDKAILFIHCSSLDSILGGAGSLFKEGMPLNILSIEKDIQRKISEADYSGTDKEILKFYLENKRRELDGTTASIFEYEDIICSLNDSQITAEEYRKFEMFPDEFLPSFTGKKLRERIIDNHINYVRISEIHSYGVDETRLEKVYGENGAKALMKPDWESISFSEIEKYILSKKTETQIEYIPIESSFIIWDKEEGSSKAKARTRNIVVFATTEEKVSLTLSFTDFTKKVGIEIPKLYQSVISCEASGKKLNVELSGIEDKAAFYHFKYSDDGAKFNFKVAVLRCSYSLIESIRSQYSIEMKAGVATAIRINTDDEEVVFNEYGVSQNAIKIIDANQIVKMKTDERTTISVGEEYPYSEDNDDVSFTISTETFSIPMIKAFAVEKPTVIEGMKLWYLKRVKKMNFDIVGDNGLAFGTKKYYSRDEFRKTLELEKKYLQLKAPFAVEKTAGGDLEKGDFSLPSSVENAFIDIVEFYLSHNLIPSLAYLSTEICQLYSNYIKAIIDEINKVLEGEYLSESLRNLFYLGMIKRQYGDYEILLSPLHPINVAYQLFINGQNIEGINIDDNEGDLLRQFQYSSLLPYINIDPYSKESKVYIPAEQIHSPEWRIYVEDSLPRYKGSKDFVSKLVAEKIQEFEEHFSYLFARETSAPIKINLINTGDCREIVQGILKYYVRELNSANKKSVIPIRVTMYSESRMDNAFELMSQIDDAEVLVNALGIEIRVEDMSTDEVIDIVRQNVQFYYKELDNDFDYAHITFVELDDDNQAISTRMDDIPTGIVMNGISSGVPSVMLGDSYRTGFGIKYASANNDLIDVAVKYNSLNAAIKGEAYRSDSCYTMKMSINKQAVLNRIYEASNWVTFINPKVDLTYFKSDLEAKDLLIIHYSDQYNMTSSGYDAITVTKKSKQYQNAISGYLKVNGVDDAENHSKRIINMFNALNGDWLLRMLSYKSHFPVEKLSILSAMKIAVKRYAVSGVIWVPISLEEILRVSGSVGLAQSGSIFSAKNLGFDGATSDDLLLIGIKPGEKVQVAFYPIEVKIGKVEPDYLEKGIKQVQKTRLIFDQILEKGSCKGKPIKTRLYRNFFMQQVMVNAGKMLLYEVGDGQQGWEQVVDSDLRRMLLEEEYEIVDTLIPEMGEAGVFSFREDCIHEREIKNQNVLIVEKTKKEGVTLLARSFSDIDSVDWELIQETADLSETNTKEIAAEIEPSPKTSLDEQKQTTPASAVSSTETPEKNTGRVLIGKDKYLHNVYWEFNNKALANRHLLITGTSGQGKTYSIQTMLYELAKDNVSAVIFDYTEGFMLQQLEEPFKTSLGDKINQQIIYSVGVPINPFQRHEVELAGEKILEKPSDVAARLADIFVHVYDFGAQQYSAVFDAAFNGMRKYGDDMNMHHFKDELEKLIEGNKTAKSVLSKMSPFFHTVDFTNDPNFDWGDILYADEAKVNIIQLTLFTREMQVIITEMMLWDAWYYTKKYGSKEKPFVVVLDEAQNLSHTMKSPSAAILTEGRKFGWSAWFATQSLKVLKDDEIVRLLQAAFKLYFKPTDDEMVKIAKQLDATGEINWLHEIHNLKKGQCIVAGDRMKASGTVGPTSPVVTYISSFDER